MSESSTAPSTRPLDKPREIFAWAMYDWANSAYSTLSITILMVYITGTVMPEWGWWIWPGGIALSMLIAALLSPLLGALADANASKLKWLTGTTILGAGSAVLLAAIPSERPWLVIAVFVITSLFFELSLGFYNGFLPEIASPGRLNRVSAYGYALGYVGGAVALLLAMGVMFLVKPLALPEAYQLRICLLIMGLWWGLFSLPTLLILRDRGVPPERKLPFGKAMRKAAGEVRHTLANVRQYKILALFLLGFLFYNDGIQTVISQASAFARKEILFSKVELLLLILMIQVLAFPGAMLVGFLADRLGQKPTLMGCLVVWVGLLAAAYFVTEKIHLWILGAVVALVMGGTQSVSRAIMAAMTPPDRAAEFFGFFSFSGKATGFLGAFMFAVIVGFTGSARLAIVSLLVFFLIGLAIVSLINVEKGRRQALETR